MATPTDKSLIGLADILRKYTEVTRSYNGRGRPATYAQNVDAIAQTGRQLADEVTTFCLDVYPKLAAALHAAWVELDTQLDGYNDPDDGPPPDSLRNTHATVLAALELIGQSPYALDTILGPDENELPF